MEESFGELFLNRENVREIDAFEKSVFIWTKDGKKHVFYRQSLTQLLKLAGLNRIALREDPSYTVEVLERYIRENGIYIGYVEKPANGGVVRFVFRATSERFTPVPHSVLFGHLEQGILKGYRWEWKQWVKRRGKFYVVDQFSIPLAEKEDVIAYGVLVTNANTGRDSIRIYGFMKVLACKNGMVASKLTKRVTVVHVGEITSILERVEFGVRRLLVQLKEYVPEVQEKFREYTEIELDWAREEQWMDAFLKKLPKRSHRWFMNVWNENVKKYGFTLYAKMQALSYVATWAKYDSAKRVAVEELRRLVP